MAKAKELFQNRIIGYATKPADQFAPNPLNYRKHPQRQRDAVNGSLRELGWIAAVVENVRTGNLIDGHERVWQALKNNEDVPFLQVDLSEEEERLALAIFDPITNMAETDAAILDELLRDVNTGEAALQSLLAELATDAGLYAEKPTVTDAEPQIDRAEELQQKWKVCLGDLWQIGNHFLMCGDSTLWGDVEILLGENKPSLCLSDPMYDCDKSTFVDFWAIARSVSHSVAVMAFGYTCSRFAEWVGAWDYDYVYETNEGLMFAHRPIQRHKLVCFWTKPQSIYNRDIHYSSRSGTSMVRFALRGSKKEVEFVYSKPIESYSHFIKIHSLPKDAIYDAFAGSGTVIAACENEDRRGFAMEKNASYCAVSLERFELLKMDISLIRRSHEQEAIR